MRTRNLRTLAIAAIVGLAATACATVDRTYDRADLDVCDARSYAVFFPTGSSALNSGAQDTIEEAAMAYDDCDLFRIEVVGYADSVGNSAANLRLSEDRAESVLDALNDRGIRADRASVVSMGERTIIDDNEPDAFERRAVVTLIPDM
ncbi:OmpA family protein [uncultured Algimonas sp.]|uniref:OmpA family protein n=1 Tax=uncultured Algimonas sp. TaxID=1547920 RepID=UPI00260C41F3|nr:OmpA family protein [uncultured Algimonas sp.]